ncbi:MAG: alpha/beta fold hydrolase [Polyangiaceae bacterium]
MPLARVNGTQLYYEDTGGDGQPLVFSHGLLWSTRMWDAQVDHFRDRFRCIAYDHRGQGRSAKPFGSSVPIETCYDDAVALIEHLDLAPCHFVGLSMGGFVGMRIAARRSDLLKSCSLLETSADPEPEENRLKYGLLNMSAKHVGIGVVTSRVMPIMFGKTFLTDPARAKERAYWRDLAAANDRSIWRAVNGVVERRSVIDELSRVRVPTLVVVGDEDIATVPAKAKRIAERIPNATLEVIAQAGHTSNVEQPRAVNAVLERFIASHR